MNLIRRIIITLVIIFLLSGVSLFAFTYYSRAESPQAFLIQLITQSQLTSSNEREQEIRDLPDPTFLSTSELSLSGTLEINLSTLFTAPVVFEEAITAPNVVYELTGGEGIELIGDPQSPTITNTGLLSLEGLSGAVQLQSDNISISTSGNTITFSADIPSLPDLPEFPDGAIVGTTDAQILSNKAVTDLVFRPGAIPTNLPGKVYYDSTNESLYVYTDTYGWRDLTAGAFTYTTDGEGIELVGNEFQLELDGNTLSKSSAGLRISALYPGQDSITTVGTITSGSWSASEILDSFIADGLTISADGTVDDGALSVNVSLLGQSIDTTEIEDQTILPEDLNSNGIAATNGYILTYNGITGLFQWLSPSTVIGASWARDDINGILYPLTPNDVVSIESTNTPLSLTNTGLSASLVVNDEASDTSPFVIDAAGNVGVGTSSPQFKLDIQGVIGVNDTRAVYVPDQSTFAGSIVFGNGGQNMSAGAGRGQNNTLVGIGAGLSMTAGDANTFVGTNAGVTNTTGYQNTFVGQAAGFANTSGYFNTFLGRSAGSSNTDGYNNVFVGDLSGQGNTNGRFNTVLGSGANRFNEQGSNNVIIGYQAAGGIGSKVGNIIIGYQAGLTETSLSNRLIIENSSSSTPLIWGDFIEDVVGINGELGVGTQSPSAKLDVLSTTTQLRLSNNLSAYANISVSQLGELGIIPTSGLVGIGTTDPTYTLDVVGTARLSGDLRLAGALYDSAGSSGAAGTILTSTGVGTTWSGIGQLLDDSYFKATGNAFGTDAQLGTTDAYSLSVITNGISRLSIDPTGDIGIGGVSPATNPALFVGSSGGVGIGTTSPLVEFQTLGRMMINTTTNSDEELLIGPNAGSTETSISMEHSGNVYELQVNQTGLFRITDASSVSEYFSINTSGQVGIGTTSPGSQLAISGLGSSTGTTLVIDASGNVWRDSSSRRYKTNIEPLQTDFRKILNIQPVAYDFTGTGVSTIGYIAEDLDALGLKDLVVYDQLGQPDAIKYDRLAIYLTEIVKEQQKSLEDISVKIAFELDSEGSVGVDMPDTSSLPSSEFENIDVQKEGNEEFLALQKLVNERLVGDIEAIQSEVTTLDDRLNALDEKILSYPDDAIATIAGRLNDLEGMLLGLDPQSLIASVAGEIDSEDMIFEDISATGKANLYDLSVTGTFTAGLIYFDTQETAVNTLAEPLRLQSERMADVEIMGGLITISQEGDLSVDGTVTASKFVVNTEDEVSATAGESSVPAGTQEIIVATEGVTDGSLIYVTFTSDYSPATRFWVSERKNGESFTLRTDKPVDIDSQFSWWIVN